MPGEIKTTTKPVSKAEARRKKALVSDKARDTATLQELKPLAKEINVRAKKAQQCIGQADDHRLAAAIRLDEAETLCRKNKINFKKWANANITDLAWDEVRRLTTVGASSDPAGALQDLRSRKAKGERKRRAEKHGPRGTSEPAPSAPKKAEFTVADDAMEACTDKTRLSLVERHATKLGHVVMPEVQVRKLKDAEKLLRECDSLTTLKTNFGKLSAPEKMEFLNWAAESVGAKITYGFEDDGTSAEKGEDIPPFLKRKKDGEKAK